MQHDETFDELSRAFEEKIDQVFERDKKLPEAIVKAGCRRATDEFLLEHPDCTDEMLNKILNDIKNAQAKRAADLAELAELAELKADLAASYDIIAELDAIRDEFAAIDAEDRPANSAERATIEGRYAAIAARREELRARYVLRKGRKATIDAKLDALRAKYVAKRNQTKGN